MPNQELGTPSSSTVRAATFMANSGQRECVSPLHIANTSLCAPSVTWSSLDLGESQFLKTTMSASN